MRLDKAGWWVLGLLLFGFLVIEPLGVPISAIVAMGAAILLFVAARGHVISTRRVIKTGPWQIVIFSIGMYLVVYGLRNAGLTASARGGDDMTETPFRLTRSLVTLHRAGLLAPVAGMAVMGASTWAMAATSAVFPDTGLAIGEIATCNPLQSDFGCGHGSGCACHLLPPEAIW